MHGTTTMVRIHFPIRNFIVCLCILFAYAGYGQQVDTSSHITQDGWIEKMNRYLTLKLGINSKIETFRVDVDPNPIVLYPNVNTNLRVSASYRFLSFGINFKPAFLPGNGDTDLKGETELSRIHVDLNFEHWIQGVHFSRIRGFFLENTKDFIDWEEGDPHIQFPDLRYFSIGGTTGYKFNPRYSLKSVATQSERQLKNAGSLVAMLHYRYYSVNDLSDPGPGGTTQKSDNAEFNARLGYFYTFVARGKFYASFGASSSIGYLHSKVTTRFQSGDFISHQNNIPFRWDAMGGIGYQGDRFYVGFFIDASGTSFRQQGTTAVNYNTLIFYQLTAGWRFPALKKFGRWLDRKKRRYP